MAKEAEAPKSVDKGKGKAVEGDAIKGKEVKKDKDGKRIVNGEDEVPEGEEFLASNLLPWRLSNLVTGEELSEEDAQLKSELDMLVERITVCLN